MIMHIDLARAFRQSCWLLNDGVKHITLTDVVPDLEWDTLRYYLRMTSGNDNTIWCAGPATAGVEARHSCCAGSDVQHSPHTSLSIEHASLSIEHASLRTEPMSSGPYPLRVRQHCCCLLQPNLCCLLSLLSVPVAVPLAHACQVWCMS